MVKQIHRYKEVREKVLSGLDTIADPVIATLSPKGSNVLFESNMGEHILTNDGVTIAKEINVKDQIENAVIDIVKGASLKTNSEAGDGTTTTILLSQVLTKEGLRMVADGKSWIEVRDMINHMSKTLVKKLESFKHEIKNDSDLENIARISSNNDDEIAKNIVKVVKVAGEDGMVFLEDNNKPETEIVEDLGFMIKSGIAFPELTQDPSRPVVTYKDVPMLITDKKVYHPEEAENILRVAVASGFTDVVIVAQGFSGEAPSVFIANHAQGVINVLLVGVEQAGTSLDDLATYLGGKVLTEKTGNLVDNLTEDDFVLTAKVYSDPTKTLITPRVTASKELKNRVAYLKEELAKDKDNEGLKRRISSLTNGVVTIKVGGSTPIETREKVYRYEDAVNATRAGMKHGYLVGGGISLLRAFKESDYEGEMKQVAKKYTESVLNQIAINCGVQPKQVLEKIKESKVKDFGYNALNDTYGDLLKEGVVDSFMAVKMSVENSVSVANILISIKNFVINDLAYENEKKNGKQD